MLEGVGATTQTIDVGGVETAVIEVGDGSPLLLLHGAIECGAAMWAPVLSELGRRHRVVAPDFPGLGESAPLSRLDVDTFGDWVAGVIDRTELGTPTIVAHSLIGSLAARFAARGADRIARLVISAAPAVGPYRMPMKLRYVAIRFAIRPTPRNAERFDRFALLDLDATRRCDPEWYRAFEEYTLARAKERHVKKTMNRLIGPQTKPISDDELARIRVPDRAPVGPPRSDGPAVHRRVRVGATGMAALRHRWRRARTADRATRGLRRDSDCHRRLELTRRVASALQAARETR